MRTTLFLGVLFILLNMHFSGFAVEPAMVSATANQLARNDTWESLSTEQKKTLEPLAHEWDSLDQDRREKWLVIANKVRSMNPDEQKRIQDRMQAWSILTPEQRAAARENYLRSHKVQPEQRNQQWQNYQQLNEEQKAQLEQHREKKKLITNLPTPAEIKNPPLPPLKKPHLIHEHR